MGSRADVSGLVTGQLVPVTVVGGYLGAGKTTLINRVLANPGGRRIAVLVNDFGAVNIDASLIAARNGNTVALTNGCVCCSITDALGDGLDQVLAFDPAPDHILIETSGAADPAKVATYGQGWPGCRLDAVVVLADVTAVRTQAADPFVGSLVVGQLTAADVVIAAKIDLAGSDGDRIVEWLADTAAGAPVVRSIHGQVDPGLLFAPGGAAPPPVRRRAAERRAALDRGARLSGEVSVDGSRPAPGVVPSFETATIEVPAGASIAEIRSMVEELPESVVRVKGIVVADDRRWLVQRVGRRTTIERAAPNVEPRALVVIATPTDRASSR